MATLAALMAQGRFSRKIDRPYADGIDVLTVLISPFIPSLRAACLEIIDFVAGFKDDRRIEVERLMEYYVWLLELRVRQTNNVRFNRDVIDIRHIIIPAIWYMQIRAIGECDKVGEGFILMPIWDESQREAGTEFAHERDFADVIRWLRLAEKHGLTILRGMPREKDGVYEVMSMQIVEEVIRNHAVVDQEAATIAGYFLNSTIEGLMPARLHYLDRHEHVLLQRDLVPSFRRGGSPTPQPKRRPQSAPNTPSPETPSSHEE
jgi:hypothetical protein